MKIGKRGWFRIHSFTGVVTGLMLFVICFSGTFAVVSHELDWLATPELRVEAKPERASWGDWADAVAQSFPEAELLWLSAPLYPVSAVVAVVDFEDQSLAKVYVDPYTAEVLGQSSFVDFQRFIRNFHMNLFGLGGFGLYLVTAFSFALLLSMIAALVFYKRWWRRFFRFRRGDGRTLLSEAHKLAGLWSLWFVVVMGITGAWYLFEIARADFGDGKFSYAGTGPSAVNAVPRPVGEIGGEPRALDALVERILQARPDLRITMLGPAASHPGAVYAEGVSRHVLVRDRANHVHIDAQTGEILYDQNASDLPLYWRWSETADPLHFGDFGGLWSKSVWFLFGLLLSGLILTGTWLHARRLAASRGAQARHRWPGTWGAVAVTLLVLVASIQAGFDQAREVYGPMVDGLPSLPALLAGPRVLIIGWSALTVSLIVFWLVLLWRPSSPAGEKHRSRPAPASGIGDRK